MTFAQEAEGMRSNPLVEESKALFHAVPFDKIVSSDYEEAVVEGIRLHDKEIEAITDNKETPSFENTIAAFDRSGTVLNRAVLTLSNLESALGDTVLMNIMTKVTPLLSEHETGVLLNEKLWERIKAVHDSKESRNDLSPEALRLIDETYRGFAESGANLEGEAREKYRKLNSELSDLTVRFSQNVTNDMSNPDRMLWVTEADTAGLPESIKVAAREAAREALEAKDIADDEDTYLFTMFMPSYSPFMKYADNRELREKLYRMYSSRNNGGTYDNIQILKDIANIRLEIAQLMEELCPVSSAGDNGGHSGEGDGASGAVA